MIFGGFQRTSLIDFPGRVASIVFVAGCNMRCHYCHNPDLVFMKAANIPESAILSEMRKRKRYIDSIVVTGGEPTIWQDLPDFLLRLRELELMIKLDTNGTNPEMLGKIIEGRLADYVAMDIKAPWQKYERVAGVKTNTKDIRRSASMLKESGIDYEFRTTLAPELETDDILEIARQISPARHWYLQRFVKGNTVGRTESAALGLDELNAALAKISSIQSAALRGF